MAVATGAGRPTIIDMKNNLIRGIRKASDFLMALQLTGAFKREALPNLQARLPAVVIGGGLTAIDTATELMAYYPLQVEKTAAQYETLAAELGEQRVRAVYDAEELEVLDEYLAHGRAVRAERARAAAAGERANFISLVRSWGGVAIAYRKRMVDSPAYRLNHEEVIKALEEGITFTENINPIEAMPDERGALKAVIFKREAKDVPAGQEQRDRDAAGADDAGRRGNDAEHHVREGSAGHVPARCEEEVLPAARRGAERRWHVSPRGGAERLLHLLCARRAVRHLLRRQPSPLRRQRRQGDGVGQGRISRTSSKLFAKELATLDPAAQPERDAAWERLVERLDDELLAVVEDVVRLTPTIVEVIVKAPAAARHFHPGPVLSSAELRVGARRASAGDAAADGRHCADRRVGRQGARAAVADRARARRVEPAVRVPEEGRAGRRDGTDRNADRDSASSRTCCCSAAAWATPCCSRSRRRCASRQPRDLLRRLQERRGPVQARGDRGGDRSGDLEHRHRRAQSRPGRPQDSHFRGNIVQAMLAYSSGELGSSIVPLPTVDRIIAIGSDRMMAAVKAARHGVLAPYLKNEHVGIGSINSPMQCMMKEVCAQCLQKHVDPVTGKEDDHLLVLQPGSGARPRRLPEPGGAAAAEHRAGKAGEHVARPPAAGSELAAHLKIACDCRIAGLQKGRAKGGLTGWLS